MNYEGKSIQKSICAKFTFLLHEYKVHFLSILNSVRDFPSKQRVHGIFPVSSSY